MGRRAILCVGVKFSRCVCACGYAVWCMISSGGGYLCTHVWSVSCMCVKTVAHLCKCKPPVFELACGVGYVCSLGRRHVCT